MIEEHQASFFDGDELLADAAVTLKITPPSAGRLGEWHGSFECDLDVGLRLMERRMLTLRLDDGRSGEVFIGRVAGNYVALQGSGSLE
jgi:hypothetical protein